jgi:hypothetical protein
MGSKETQLHGAKVLVLKVSQESFRPWIADQLARPFPNLISSLPRNSGFSILQRGRAVLALWPTELAADTMKPSSVSSCSYCACSLAVARHRDRRCKDGSLAALAWHYESW